MIKQKTTFKEWLQEELLKPAPDHYDPNGNSPRAITTRGLYKEVLYQYKQYPKGLLLLMKDFDGMRTEISWFITLPVSTLLGPIVPIIWGIGSYKRALKLYRSEYNEIT